MLWVMILSKLCLFLFFIQAPFTNLHPGSVFSWVVPHRWSVGGVDASMCSIAAHIYACSTLLSMWNVHYRVLRWILLQIALSIINFYQLLPTDSQPHMSHFTLAWSIISKRQRQANLKYKRNFGSYYTSYTYCCQHSCKHSPVSVRT